MRESVASVEGVSLRWMHFHL